MPLVRKNPDGSILIGITENRWILFLLIGTKRKMRARTVPTRHDKNNMTDHCILTMHFTRKKVSGDVSHTRAVRCNTLCFIIQSDPASNPLEVMPHVMRHPCGSSKPVMDPRVALRLPEDDKERCHAALDAASMRIIEAGDGSPDHTPLARG